MSDVFYVIGEDTANDIADAIRKKMDMLIQN